MLLTYYLIKDVKNSHHDGNGHGNKWAFFCNSDLWSLLCSATRPLRLLLTSLCWYSCRCAQLW